MKVENCKKDRRIPEKYNDPFMNEMDSITE
jgi:hypothetical protein